MSSSSSSSPSSSADVSVLATLADLIEGQVAVDNNHGVREVQCVRASVMLTILTFDKRTQSSQNDSLGKCRSLQYKH